MLLIATAAPASCGLPVLVVRGSACGNGFPSFLPKEVEMIRDPSARQMFKRIERLPVTMSFSNNAILSSCVKPLKEKGTEPVVLLHGFDSSCIEWRYSYPLLEDAGVDAWALDILGWGFSDLEPLPSCDVAAKREHFYQFWRTYIERPMVLIGPSLGAAVAIDFAVNHPEAVSRLILIDASVFSEGTGNLSKLPRFLAYAGVWILKSIPLRRYANTLVFNDSTLGSSPDCVNVGRLHCLLPWWEDATVNFMVSGGYDVRHQIKQIKKKTLIIWGEEDRIVRSSLGLKLHEEISDSVFVQIPGSGHLPHVEKPEMVIPYILEFLKEKIQPNRLEEAVIAPSSP